MIRTSTFVAASLALTSFAHAYAATGNASYYGGRGRTASGAHVGHMTAAHKTLPFGTMLRVTNLHNHRSAVVTVNDRGPFVRGRIVDVSVGAAGALGMRGSGVAPVRIEVVARGDDVAPTTRRITARGGAIVSDAVETPFNPFAALFGAPNTTP